MTVQISIRGLDQSGVVAAVADRLFDLGLNLGDTSFAVLGTGFEFNTIAEPPQGMEPEQIRKALAGLDHLSGCEVAVKEFEHGAVRQEAGLATHSVVFRGGDQPGLLARLTEVLLDFGANIVRLNADRIPGGAIDHYVTACDISIPAERAQPCLAALANTAGQLQLTCEWRDLNAPLG